MGIIVDQNPNASANDNWALVSNGVVTNDIVANLSFIQTIQSSYDYLVDYTYGGQSEVGPGYSYDPNTDTFSPPPTDWVEAVREDFNVIAAALAQCLSDADNLNSTDLGVAYSEALSDSSSSFTANEQDLMDAINTYISNGG